jgi:very-short-patch-repair endonuclease
MGAHRSTDHLLQELRILFGSTLFTVEQARAHGVPLRSLQYLASEGSVQRAYRGHYRMTSDDPDDGGWQVASSLIRAMSPSQRAAIVMGGSAAARTWGMQTSEKEPVIWFEEGSGLRRGSRAGVLLRQGGIPDGERVLLDGILVTLPLRTAVDLACAQRDEGEVGWLLCQGLRREAEWCVAARLGRPIGPIELANRLEDDRFRSDGVARLDAILGGHHGHGIARVKRIASSIDVRLESGLEVRSWLRFRRSALPIPRLQVWVRGASGRFYRVDYLWDRVIGEADGAVKYHRPQDLWEEKRRQEDLERAGFIVVRWTWAEIVHAPDSVIERVRQAMARSAA